MVKIRNDRVLIGKTLGTHGHPAITVSAVVNFRYMSVLSFREILLPLFTLLKTDRLRLEQQYVVKVPTSKPLSELLLLEISVTMVIKASILLLHSVSMYIT